MEDEDVAVDVVVVVVVVVGGVGGVVVARGAGVATADVRQPPSHRRYNPLQTRWFGGDGDTIRLPSKKNKPGTDFEGTKLGKTRLNSVNSDEKPGKLDKNSVKLGKTR